MNLNEMMLKLKSISYALNQLEVKGRENLDILLGSIQELDRASAIIERHLKEQKASQQEVKVELEEIKTEVE